MNRTTANTERLVRVPVLMDVKTYVQLAGKAKRNGVSIVKRNSDIIASHIAQKRAGLKTRT
jgi:hypothetical protein